MTLTPRVFPAVSVTGGLEHPERIERADVEIVGLEHGEGSYGVRVFVNNPEASAETEGTAEEGYAGAVYVYGAGLPATTEKVTPGPRLTSMRSVAATEAVRTALINGVALSVTLVPVVLGGSEHDVNLGGATVSILIRS